VDNPKHFWPAGRLNNRNERVIVPLLPEDVRRSRVA
jgi:hypothetical protein